MNALQDNEDTIFSQKFFLLDAGNRDKILKALELTGGYSTGQVSILLDLGMDTDTIIAAIIRSRPEMSRQMLAGSSTELPNESLPEFPSDQISPQAALLVQGLKRIDALKTACRTVYEAQNIRNMLFALADDVREIFIKLAEKLHSMRVMDLVNNDEMRKTAARECLDVYAPIADRLGISWIKNEMEDLSLKFLNRDTFQQIKNMVSEKIEKRNQSLEVAREAIKREAKTAGIEIQVESRAKHFYSIYMKMRKRGISAEMIYDLSGIRIICGSIEYCYTLLGVVHRLWRPVSGCFKDYIANPKENGYQSLHTTVLFGIEADMYYESDPEIGNDGKRMEIQIRTHEMHQIAENGIASHWLYKKGASRDMVNPDDIGIVNKLKEWKHYGDDTGELSSGWLEDIKLEILRNRIYVFTPQGKVIKLPPGSTPIDFAYHIHTAIGEHCIGAKADGSIIPLSSRLINTQTVEILTSNSAHPHPNWLQLAKAPKTRSKIRSWLEKYDDSFGIEKPAEQKKKAVSEPAAEAHSLVQDKVSTFQVIPKENRPLSSVLQVRIEDEKNMLIRFARCCNPVSGDPITGYISRGRGIIIHRQNCSNLANNPELEKRRISAEWDNAKSETVKRFRIIARFSPNLFSEIESAIRKHQGQLIEGRLEEYSMNRLSGNFTMQILEGGDLKQVMKNIKLIPGIQEIRFLN